MLLKQKSGTACHFCLKIQHFHVSLDKSKSMTWTLVLILITNKLILYYPKPHSVWAPKSQKKITFSQSDTKFLPNAAGKEKKEKKPSDPRRPNWADGNRFLKANPHQWDKQNLTRHRIRATWFDRVQAAATMVKTDHGTRHSGESNYWSDVQCDCDEVEPDNRPCTDHERLGRLVGFCFSQSLDQAFA